MKDKVIGKNLRIVLNTAMIILVFALILTFFLTSIKVVSKGVTEVPADISLFDYVTSKNIWLIFSFIFCILTVFSGVALICVTCLEVVGVIKHNKYKDIVGIVIIITSILSLVFTIIYCAIKTPFSVNTDDVYLKFIPYWGIYITFTCGFVSGILALFDSPILRENQSKNTSK